MSDNVEIIHNVLLDKIKVTSSIFVINIAKIFIERDAFVFFFLIWQNRVSVILVI